MIIYNCYFHNLLENRCNFIQELSLFVKSHCNDRKEIVSVFFKAAVLMAEEVYCRFYLYLELLLHENSSILSIDV